MYYRIDDTFVLNLKVKLFAALPCQRLFRRFARLDLAAHELPQPTLRFVRSPLPDKIAFAITYDGSNDFDYALVLHGLFSTPLFFTMCIVPYLEVFG